MRTHAWLSILLSASVTLTTGCEAEPTVGDEQNQTEDDWDSDIISDGPDAFDVTGHHRVAAAAAKDGSLLAAFVDPARHLSLATSSGSGKWTVEVVKQDGECGAYASIALDDDGTIHLVHRDRDAGGLMHASRTGTGAWTHTPIGTGLGDNRLLRGADGTLHLLATQWDPATKSDTLTYARRAPGGAWSLEPLANGERFVAPALTLDEAGVPHVVAWQWTDESLDSGRLVLATRASGAWASEPLTLPASYTADLLVHAGTTHLVYVAPDEKGAFYTTRAGAGAWSTPETIIGWDAWDPDLEIAANGQPHIVMSSEGNIRYASRGDAGTWATSVVARGGGGFIAPYFIAGTDRELVFSDWGRGSFRHAWFDGPN